MPDLDPDTPDAHPFPWPTTNARTPRPADDDPSAGDDAADETTPLADIPDTAPPAPAARPASHAVLASCALLACWPVGIPAVVASYGVNTALLDGNVALAQQRSRDAYHWAMAALAIGLLLTIVVAVLVVALTSLLASALLDGLAIDPATTVPPGWDTPDGRFTGPLQA